MVGCFSLWGMVWEGRATTVRAHLGCGPETQGCVATTHAVLETGPGAAGGHGATNPPSPSACAVHGSPLRS